MQLDSRVAIITGGGGGLGRAIALKLASQGARIVVVDVDEANAARVADDVTQADGQALAVRADITKPGDVQKMVAAACTEFGSVDILVNNAGYAKLCPSVMKISNDDWDRTIAINLTSSFVCSKAVLRILLDKGSGQIVNIASLAGRSTSTIGSAAYTASKAGVIGLTRHVAREVAARGIRVNAVCPGPIDTKMVRGPLNDSEVDAVGRRIPMRHLGTPEDVAGAVAFLVSDDARYITGACIDVNGGLLMI